jgi:hypothetical protein
MSHNRSCATHAKPEFVNLSQNKCSQGRLEIFRVSSFRNWTTLKNMDVGRSYTNISIVHIYQIINVTMFQRLSFLVSRKLLFPDDVIKLNPRTSQPGINNVILLLICEYILFNFALRWPYTYAAMAISWEQRGKPELAYTMRDRR